MQDDLMIRNARHLASRVHAKYGTWKAAALAVGIDQASLWRLADGKTTKVDTALFRRLAMAADEEPAVAISMDLDVLRGTL